MPILYVLEYSTTAHGDFSQISYAESNLCRFSPSGNPVKHQRWNFVRNVSQREAFNCSTSYLATIKPHLRCLIGIYLNVPLKAAPSDIMKTTTSHSQLQPHSRLLVVFKNTISCKSQSKNKPNELVN